MKNVPKKVRAAAEQGVLSQVKWFKQLEFMLLHSRHQVRSEWLKLRPTKSWFYHSPGFRFHTIFPNSEVTHDSPELLMRVIIMISKMIMKMTLPLDETDIMTIIKTALSESMNECVFSPERPPSSASARMFLLHCRLGWREGWKNCMAWPGILNMRRKRERESKGISWWSSGVIRTEGEVRRTDN